MSVSGYYSFGKLWLIIGFFLIAFGVAGTTLFNIGDKFVEAIFIVAGLAVMVFGLKDLR